MTSTNVSQALGAPLYLVNENWYNAWISFTKQSFNLLTITLTQWWAPITVQVSGDASMRGQLFKSVEGNLICNFPERLILIANHQIYTDWLYLWWIAHCGGAAGRIYIILKESLKKIPVIGWGIQLSQFILLKRNWEEDKPHLSKHLQKLNNQDPMWLLLFPEGTNLASSTRLSSKKWATKNSIPDMQHTLHPRTTGLQFCLQELRQTVGYLYDCTIAYEGVPRGQYAQDTYTLQAQYLQGKPPEKIHMYWRRFRISEIPVDNTKSFESWLRARWIEKDAYIEHYYRIGQMPCDRGITAMPDGTKRKGCGYIETTIKATAWHEFLQAFAPIGALSLVLYTLYNQLPQNFLSSASNVNQKTIMDKVNSIGRRSAALKKSLTANSGEPILTFNSDKVSNEQAVALMQKATKQAAIQNQNTKLPTSPSLKSSNLSVIHDTGTISIPIKRAPSVSILPKKINTEPSKTSKITNPTRSKGAISKADSTQAKQPAPITPKPSTTAAARKLPAAAQTSRAKNPANTIPTVPVARSVAQTSGTVVRDVKPTTTQSKVASTISKPTRQANKPVTAASKLTIKKSSGIAIMPMSSNRMGSNREPNGLQKAE